MAVQAKRGNVCGLFLLAFLASCGNSELAGEQEPASGTHQTNETNTEATGGSPRPATPPEPVLVAPDTLYELADKNPAGTSFLIRVTGSNSGSVWGSDVYTTDSSLSKVAVHLGLVKPEETAVVRVTLKPGQDSYESSSRNGVSTSSFGAYRTSFVMERYTSAAVDRPAVPLVDVISDPGSLSSLASKHQAGKSFLIQVTGKTSGSVWGSDIYTTDSSLATAAVHAGLVKSGETAIVEVTLKPGQDEYKGSSRNEVSTNSYGSYSASYVIEKYTLGGELVRNETGGKPGVTPLMEKETPGGPEPAPHVPVSVSVRTSDYDMLTFTPDSRSLLAFRDRVATRQLDYELWLWNLEDRQSKQVGREDLGQEGRRAAMLRSSSDGRLCVTGNWPMGSIALWDTEKRRLLRSDSGHDRVKHVSLSPDNKWIASLGEQGNLLLWEIGENSLKPLLLKVQLPSGYIQSIVALNDGKGVILAGTDTYSVRLTPADGGEDQTLWKPKNGVHDPYLRLSPDGKTLAVDGVLIDLATKQASARLPFPDEFREDALWCWSPDGTKLAFDVAYNYQPCVLIWNVAGKRVEQRLTYDEPFPLERLEFSPDGTQVLAASAREKRFAVWRLENTTAPGQSSQMPPQPKTVQIVKPRMKFRTNSSPILFYKDNGRRLVCQKRIIDLLTGQEKLAGAIDSPLAPINNGESALMAKSDIRVIVNKNGEFEQQKFPFKYENRPVAGVYHVAATSDGGWLAAYCSDLGSVAYGMGSIQLWRIQGNDLTSRGVLPRKAHAMAFLGTQGPLVTGGDNGDVALWNIATLKEIAPLKGQPGKVVAVAASTDGKQIAAGSEKGVSHWQAAATEGGEPTHRRFSEFAARVLAFSPDGKWLAVVYNDGQPELVETATGQVRCRFEVENSRSDCLAFSPDSNELAIGANSHDGHIRIFNLP